MVRKYDAIKNTLFSIRAELKYSANWFSAQYCNEENIRFWKMSYIFKVDTAAIREIISKGLLSSLMSKDYLQIEKIIGKLTIYSERVLAFNQMIDYYGNLVSSNPDIAQKTRKLLHDYNIEDNNPLQPDLQGLLTDWRYIGIKEFLLNVREINYIVHFSLISRSEDENGLYSLWKYLTEKIDDLIRFLDKEKLMPWYLRAPTYFLFPLILFFALWFIFILSHLRIV